MNEMFNNYPQPEDYKPDNRPQPIEEFKLDIMTGETAIHTFEVPFKISEECSEVEVVYKLGIKPTIIKNSDSLELIETEEGTTIVTCTLSQSETKLFEDTILSLKLQMKFYMNNNSIMYSDIYSVEVKDALDINREIPEEE